MTSPLRQGRKMKLNFLDTGVLAVLLFTLGMPVAPVEASSAEAARTPVDFKLPHLEDPAKTTSLSDFRGQVVLLNLWASWCTGCRKEMTEFITLQKEFRQKKFAVVAVNLDDQKGRALSFLKKYAQAEGQKIGFLTLYDKDKSLADRLNPTAFPASYLIDVSGNLVKSYVGSISDKDLPLLRREIDALLKENR